MLPAWLESRPLRVLLPLQAVLLGVRPRLLPVWGDEQFTLNVIAGPWSELMNVLEADIHPPLYFVLVKLWAQAARGIDPVVAARLFSAICALLTTVALDLLWMRRRDPRERFWMLALWAASPLVLLYARMARSYALQALLAVAVFYLARSAVERPTWTRLAGVSAGLAALLYTHYLPGLAVGFAVFVLLMRVKPAAAVATIAGTGFLYSPWAAVLLEGLSRAASKEAYQLAPNAAAELALRTAYWGLSFTFGEAQTWLSICCAAGLSLALGVLLMRQESAWTVEQRLAVWAAPVGLLGTWLWVSFAFTPARLLFLAPAWLLTLALLASQRLGRAALAALLAFYIAADGLYFARVGLLNPGYEIPFDTIAREIETTSSPSETVVIVDAASADPSPLTAAIDGRFKISAVGDGSLKRAAERAPSTIWLLQTARAASRQAPNAIGGAYRLKRSFAYVRYSPLQRSALELLTGAPAPEHHYEARRYERKSD